MDGTAGRVAPQPRGAVNRDGASGRGPWDGQGKGGERRPAQVPAKRDGEAAARSKSGSTPPPCHRDWVGCLPCRRAALQGLPCQDTSGTRGGMRGGKRHTYCVPPPGAARARDDARRLPVGSVPRRCARGGSETPRTMVGVGPRSCGLATYCSSRRGGCSHISREGSLVVAPAARRRARPSQRPGQYLLPQSGKRFSVEPCSYQAPTARAASAYSEASASSTAWNVKRFFVFSPRAGQISHPPTRVTGAAQGAARARGGRGRVELARRWHAALLARLLRPWARSAHRARSQT